MTIIETARSLYEQKKLDEVVSLLPELINHPEYKFESRILYAKCIIHSMGPINEEDSEIGELLDIYYSQLTDIASEVESLEELFNIENDLAITWENSHLAYTKKYAKLCQEEAKFDDWIKYIRSTPPFLSLNLKTKLMLRQIVYDRFGEAEFNKVLAKFKDENGETEGDRYSTEKKRRDILLGAAVNLYARAKAMYNEFDDCSAAMAEVLAPKVLRFAMLAELILSSETPKKEDGEEGLRLDVMKLRTEILNWELKTVVHYEGKSISIYSKSSGRSDEIKKLKSLYQEILELEPTFIPPELPDETPVSPPAPASSGGCYVATAVYGSYDCPQVWTLRRFRDDTLAETWYGRLFIHMYYAISPTLVKWFGNTEGFKNFCKPKLDKLVMRLNYEGVQNTPYNDKQW